jgi:hypothetical protein
MSRARSKGRAWELKVAEWLCTVGFRAQRSESVADLKGDVHIAGCPVVIEAKDHSTKLDLATWVRQAQKSAKAKGCEGMWVIVAHRKGYSSPEDAYLIVSPAILSRALDSVRFVTFPPMESSYRVDL